MAALAFSYARGPLSMLAMWRRADRGLRGAPLLGLVARLGWRVRKLDDGGAYWCVASLDAIKPAERDAVLALVRGPLRAVGWRLIAEGDAAALNLSSKGATLDRVLLTVPSALRTARGSDPVSAGAQPLPTLLLAFDSHSAVSEAIDALATLADTDVIEGTHVSTGPTAARAVGSSNAGTTTSIVGGWWLLVPSAPTFLSGRWLEAARSRNGVPSAGPVQAYRAWSMAANARSVGSGSGSGSGSGDDGKRARVFIAADEEPALLVDVASELISGAAHELLLVARAHSVARLDGRELVPLADRLTASADASTGPSGALTFTTSVGHAIDVTITITPPIADAQSTEAVTALDNLHVADCLWCCPESALRHRPWWLDDLRLGARGNLVVAATQHPLRDGTSEVVYWLREVFPGHAVAELFEIAVPFTRYRPGRRDVVGRRIDSADRRETAEDAQIYIPAGARVEPEVGVHTLALALRGASTSRLAEARDAPDALAAELVVLVPVDADGRIMVQMRRGPRGTEPTWAWRQIELPSAPSRPLTDMADIMWRGAADRLHALVGAAALVTPPARRDLERNRDHNRGAGSADEAPGRDQEWW